MDTSTHKARVSIDVPMDLKQRLQQLALKYSVSRGYFVSMQACIVELLGKHLPPLSRGADKKPARRAMRSAP